MPDLIEFQDGDVTLRGRWFEPETAARGRYPAVLLATGDGPNGSHGLTWVNISKMLVNKGIGAFLFDFAGLGESDGERRDLSIAVGVSNFRAALAQLRLHEGHDPDRIGVLAASFGGNAALLAAGDERDLSAIALKSPCSYLPEAFVCEFGHAKVEEWAEQGYLEEIGFNYAVFVEALRHSTYVAAEKVSAEVRIVHGDADSVVPFRQSMDLLRFLPNGSLRTIPDADHWYADGNQWDVMAQDLVDFLSKAL